VRTQQHHALPLAMAQNQKSVFSQLLQKTLDSNPDIETAAHSILKYLQDSQLPSTSSTRTSILTGGDLDYDRFQKSYQKVIQDNKIFGHKISNSSSQDLTEQLLNEFTTRYVTAKELQQKYLVLESSTQGIAEQRLFQEHSILLLKEKNMKDSLQKLYQVRSHDIPALSQRGMSTEERIILLRKRYRVSSSSIFLLISLPLHSFRE
jgi:hypothetical protein